MPSRPLSLIIILCWLGMGVWLFLKDLWPLLRPGEPPAYTLMASDEAPRQGSLIRWNVFHNGSHAYSIEAKTLYHEKGADPSYDDTFEMQAFIRVVQQSGEKTPQRRLRAFLHFTRDGELRAVNAQLHIAVKEIELLIEVEGPVHQGRLFPRWVVKAFPLDENTEARVFDRWAPAPATVLHQFSMPLQPVAFAERGIVLNPFQSPNRLDELRPGQHWDMPLVGNLLILESLGKKLHTFVSDPRLEDLITLLQNTLGPALADVPILAAHVLPQPKLLPPPLGDSPRPTEPPLCWVIDAQDEDARVQARLWIQQSEGERKGLVLLQETVFTTDHGDDVWIVQRE
jgi:hypothetical protein